MALLVLLQSNSWVALDEVEVDLVAEKFSNVADTVSASFISV
jgi:hypothetical protein